MRTGRVVSARSGPGLLAAAAVCVAPAATHANILGITINNADTNDYTLTSVTLTRGAAGAFTYTPAQLIGVDVTDIAATGNSLAVQVGAPVPAPGARATLLEDNRLDTGLINPFSTGSPADDAFEVTFLRPVINSDGADLLVFEIGGGDPTAFWVNNDRVNHRYDVTASSFNTNLLTGVPFTQYAYANPGGGTNVNGLAALESPTGWGGTGADGSTAIAGLALDLSSFGIAPGGSVTSLRWQTTSTPNRLDAVYVAGLPAVPEPASLSLLAAAGVGLLARRPRCA